MQRWRHDVKKIEAARQSNGSAQHLGKLRLHPGEPGKNFGVVGTISQRLTSPLVERGKGLNPGGAVLDHENGRALGDDASVRAKGIVILGWNQANRILSRERFSLLEVDCYSGMQKGTDN